MIRAINIVALIGMTVLGESALAQQSAALSVRDSFRIGSGGVLCTAQSRPLDAVLNSMFDRSYSVICRDAAASVGTLYALRASADDPVAAIAARRPENSVCQAPTEETVEGLGAVRLTICTQSNVSYRTYSVRRGNTVFVADGLGGYDSALRLGLRAVVTDRAVLGNVEVATTAAGDPAAFARIQAGTLDADSALTEAYFRNNSGNYAEAAEFFGTLTERSPTSGQLGGTRSAEYLANEAIQQSNLGNFAAAETMLSQAEASSAAADPVTGRLVRNFRAIHALNQRLSRQALAELAKPVSPIIFETDNAMPLRDGIISPVLADQINRENASLERLGGIDGRLRPAERAQILDGQAAQLRGVALRTEGRYGEARRSLDLSTRTLTAVRDGRVTSVAFLRSQNFSELGAIEEAEGNFAAAETAFAESARILDLDYPLSAAGLAATARYAGFLGRRGETDRALALYATVVSASEEQPSAVTAMRNLLAPYFALLLTRAASDPEAISRMFAAGQILQRPGLAQTQAVLARELSSGDDDAARLFRQSVTQQREIARTSGEIARLVAQNPQPSDEAAGEIATARARLETVRAEQTVLQSLLGEFQRYRVLAPTALTLSELQQTLKDGEGYYQMRVVGQEVYAILVTPTAVRGARLESTAAQLESNVATLRESIVTTENGTIETFPFDAVLARQLYKSLFEPFGDVPASITHLIFEPDGALLQLPANLLIMEQAGVDAYAERVAAGADAFDFTGIEWFGRDRDISTAVSPRAFVDVRGIAPARGSMAYLGLGQNVAPAAGRVGTGDCNWPQQTWENPIDNGELLTASGYFGTSQSAVITDAEFSDSAIKARTDLENYRVIHFATHGLVTAPRPECPARPALLTSFGDADSDGLLTFREIFDLRFDAELVVLSACDTAGKASVNATRDAGLTTGGDFALDGLVRAFVGAGARTVVASHWPVPDDFDATQRLIQGLFAAPAGTPVATSLRMSQRLLMDQAATSHPYYWSAFAVVGDGGRALTRD